VYCIFRYGHRVIYDAVCSLNAKLSSVLRARTGCGNLLNMKILYLYKVSWELVKIGETDR